MIVLIKLKLHLHKIILNWLFYREFSQSKPFIFTETSWSDEQSEIFSELFFWTSIFVLQWTEIKVCWWKFIRSSMNGKLWARKGNSQVFGSEKIGSQKLWLSRVKKLNEFKSALSSIRHFTPTYIHSSSSFVCWLL